MLADGAGCVGGSAGGDDGFGLLVFEFGEVADAGRAVVEAGGGGDGDNGSGDVSEKGEE